MNLSAFLFAYQELLFQLNRRIDSKTRRIPTIFMIVILSEKANTPIIVATTNSIDATTGGLSQALNNGTVPPLFGSVTPKARGRTTVQSFCAGCAAAKRQTRRAARDKKSAA